MLPDCPVTTKEVFGCAAWERTNAGRRRRSARVQRTCEAELAGFALPGMPQEDLRFIVVAVLRRGSFVHSCGNETALWIDSLRMERKGGMQLLKRAVGLDELLLKPSKSDAPQG